MDLNEEELAEHNKLKREARLMALYVQNYKESSGSSSGLLKWMLTVLAGILVTSISGAVVFYGGVQRLQSSFDAWREAFEKRLDRIEDRLDGRAGAVKGRGAERDATSP